MTEYERVGSFECAPVSAVGVADSVVGVAGGGRVTLVTGADRTDFDHDEPIVDMALGERVLLLSASELTAYDRDGARIWTRTFSAPHAVATTPESDRIGVLEPEQLRIVDPGSGQETAVVDRTPPGRPDDDQLLGTAAGFVTATWSVIHCFSPTGDVVFEHNLDAAIRDIGTCGGVLVAALQNGTLRGFDAESGEPLWETELPVRQLSPRGTNAVLLRSDDGIKSVKPDGTIDSVGSVATGAVYTDSTGSLVCSIRDGTVTTHVPAAELLDVAVLTETVGVGGTVEIEARNRTDTEEQLTVVGALTHADLAPSERRLKVDPGGTTVTDFPIEAVRTDGDTEFTVTVGDQVVARRTVTITDAAETTATVDATLEPVAIRDDTVEIDLTVENTGTLPLETVRELETEASTTDTGPGETWTTTLEKPFEPERNITVGLEVRRANRRTELAPTCQLPPRPSIDSTQRRNALHARIEADDAVTWTDELVIEVPGAGRVRSPVEIEDGSLLVVLPVYESGVARIALSAVDVSERTKMTAEGPLNTLGNRSGSGGVTVRDQPTRETTADAPSGTEGSASTTEVSTRDEGGSDESETSGGEFTASQDRGATPDCRVERHLSAEAVAVGHCIRERLVVTNDGATLVTPQLQLGEERLAPGELGPDDSAVFERQIVRFSADEGALSLPSGELRVDETTVDRLASEELEPASGWFQVRGVVDPDDGSYDIDVWNQGENRRQLTAIDLGGQQLLSTPVELHPGATETFTGHLSSRPEAGRDIVTGTVTTAESGTVTAGLLVDSVEASGAPEILEATIGAATKVAGDYGTLVLAVENRSSETLTDITLAADGEMINDIVYSEAHQERLEPGARIEHYVDLKTTAGTVDIELTASYTNDDGTHTRMFTAAGPAVNTEAEWTEGHREQWTLSDETDANGQGATFPPSVTTAYSRIE